MFANKCVRCYFHFNYLQTHSFGIRVFLFNVGLKLALKFSLSSCLLKFFSRGFVSCSCNASNMSHSFTAVTIFFNEHLRLHPPMRLQISPAQLAMDVVLQEKFCAHDIYTKKKHPNTLFMAQCVN